MEQLWSWQSMAHPVDVLQVALTKGATQVKMPCASWKVKSKGVRHAAQLGFVDCSKEKNESHAGEWAPPALHAARASARSAAGQTCWMAGATVATPAPGQPGYGSGQVFWAFAHTRGVTARSHVEPEAVQSAQAAAPDPQRLLRKPP